MHLPVGMTYYYRQMLMPQADHDLLAGWQVSGDRDGVLDTLAHDTQEHEFGLRLPELLLMRIDRFSMANSVEARVPFLAPALVEWAFHLHPTLKNNGRLGKLVLRKAIESLLPAHVMNRPKRGFGAPVDAWLDETMGELLTSLLTEDCIRAYFDVDVLAERLSGGGDRKLAFSLWPILNFALWHRYWIEGVSLESLVGDHVGVG
jgi:asparagine synthase (glutamine-hydrolysing)